jgi:predicted nuclease of predicted toxin-antitoxin system
MKLWIDAQLSPAIADWIGSEYGLDATAVRDLGLRDAEDGEIFQQARIANVAVMTKDKDFVLLLDRFGPPPQIIWLTCGNTSNQKLKAILRYTLDDAIRLLDSGEAMVEINEPF